MNKLQAGQEIYTNHCIEFVIVLYVDKDYCLLLRDDGRVIKAHGWEIKDNKLGWMHGEYFSNDIFRGLGD